MNNREKFYAERRDDVAALKRAYDILIEFQPDLARIARKEDQKKVLAWAAIAVTAAAATIIGVIVQAIFR